MTGRTGNTQEMDRSETAMARAKRLAERIVGSMRQQGYQDIEYILTECQVKIVASASGKSPRTQYLTLPTSGFSSFQRTPRVAENTPRPRFVL